jgi:DNA polymerase-3 subunit epsilon
MKIDLKNDLIFLDIEATGLNVVRDRIVQIAMIKYPADGTSHSQLVQMINPGIPISEEAMAVHGILPKDLANKPVFQQVADELYNFIGDADLAGYNLHRLDVPLLMEEFNRVGKDFNIDHRKFIDVQRIFYKMEPRDLRAAYRYYCGREMSGTHDALEDVQATVEVLMGQLERYSDTDYEDGDGHIDERPVRPDVQALHDFTMDKRNVEPTQKLRYNPDGEVIFNFGRYLGKPVAKTLVEDPQYYNWMLKKEFSSQVKQIIRKLVHDYQQSSDT